MARILNGGVFECAGVVAVLGSIVDKTLLGTEGWITLEKVVPKAKQWLKKYGGALAITFDCAQVSLFGVCHLCF